MKLYMFKTVRLSIIRSLFTAHSALVYVIQDCRQLSSRTRMEQTTCTTCNTLSIFPTKCTLSFCIVLTINTNMSPNRINLFVSVTGREVGTVSVTWIFSSESLVVMFSTTVISKLQEQLLSTHHSAVCCFHFIASHSFNPLNTKRRPLYLKTQSVPRCKHFSSRL